LILFLNQYQQQHGLESRSAVLTLAVKALREQSMLEGYEELGRAQLSGEQGYGPIGNLDGLH
jgi:hypothetical protein